MATIQDPHLATSRRLLQFAVMTENRSSAGRKTENEADSTNRVYQQVAEKSEVSNEFVLVRDGISYFSFRRSTCISRSLSFLPSECGVPVFSLFHSCSILLCGAGEKSIHDGGLCCHECGCHFLFRELVRGASETWTFFPITRATPIEKALSGIDPSWYQCHNTHCRYGDGTTVGNWNTRRCVQGKE